MALMESGGETASPENASTFTEESGDYKSKAESALKTAVDVALDAICSNRGLPTGAALGNVVGSFAITRGQSLLRSKFDAAFAIVRSLLAIIEGTNDPALTRRARAQALRIVANLVRDLICTATDGTSKLAEGATFSANFDDFKMELKNDVETARTAAGKTAKMYTNLPEAMKDEVESVISTARTDLIGLAKDVANLQSEVNGAV